MVVGNVGDSRVYWIAEDEAACLTEDDSLARELAALGADPAEIAGSGQQHAIVRWLGIDAPDEPYRVGTFTPPGRGRLVVCSDGLWNYADTAAELAALVPAVADVSPGDVAHTLVDHALRSGGDDNVTVVVVDVDVAPIDAALDSPEELP